MGSQDGKAESVCVASLRFHVFSSSEQHERPGGQDRQITDDEGCRSLNEDLVRRNIDSGGSLAYLYWNKNTELVNIGVKELDIMNDAHDRRERTG